jgi:formamidopyrimidine-DNA glycosylase
MPELPEVELFRRFLDRHAGGRVLRRVSIHDHRLLRGAPASAFRTVAGRRVGATRRHGKYLFAEVPGAGWLLFHFGMTGDLERFGSREPRSPAVAACLLFADGGGVAFLDQRKFGRFGLIDDPGRFVRERRLGLDALEMDRAGFEEIVRTHRGSLKALLMNQSAVAGIGNLYADEILFQARLHPLTPARRLGSRARQRLYDATRHVLRAGIERQAAGRPLPRTFLLRHRDEDGLCPRCRAPFSRLLVAGRTTVFCPRHQRGARRQVRPR